MKKSAAFATSSLLGLIGCTSIGALESAVPENQISGTVTRRFVEPHRVEIALDGKTYRGEWRTEAPTREQKAGTDKKHWFHFGQVRSTLSADDGSKMECQWKTHTISGTGICVVGGREYPLVLK